MLVQIEILASQFVYFEKSTDVWIVFRCQVRKFKYTVHQKNHVKNDAEDASSDSINVIFALNIEAWQFLSKSINTPEAFLRS